MAIQDSRSIVKLDYLVPIPETTASGAMMVSLQRKEQIAQSLRQLTEIYRSNLTEYEQTLATLSALLDLEAPSIFSRTVSLEQTPSNLLADPTTFCAVYRNGRCYLGNTLVFGLFRLLVSRLNRYVPYSELLAEVWKQDEKSPEAIRTVVQILRKKLRAASMIDIAEAIDGSNHGHYGLILARNK